jgi:hypothetical protein
VKDINRCEHASVVPASGTKSKDAIWRIRSRSNGIRGDIQKQLFPKPDALTTPCTHCHPSTSRTRYRAYASLLRNGSLLLETTLLFPPPGYSYSVSSIVGRPSRCGTQGERVRSTSPCVPQPLYPLTHALTIPCAHHPIATGIRSGQSGRAKGRMLSTPSHLSPKALCNWQRVP